MPMQLKPKTWTATEEAFDPKRKSGMHATQPEPDRAVPGQARLSEMPGGKDAVNAGDETGQDHSDLNELLSQIIIELNVLRKNVVLYPSSHPGVAASLDRVHDSLEKLCRLNPELTVGAAKDCLIVNKQCMDRKRPGNKQFALALSQRAIAAVTFIGVVKKEEILTLASVLTRSPEEIAERGGAAAVLERAGVEHIRVRVVDYGLFHLTEETGIDPCGPGGKSPDNFWIEFVDRLVSGQVGGRTEGRLAAPSEIAEFFNRYEVDVPAALELYHQLTNDPAAFESQEFPEHFESFLATLNPKIQKQFLNAAIAKLSPGQNEAVEVLEHENILEILKEISDKDSEISPSFLAIAQKLDAGEKPESPDLEVRDTVQPTLAEHGDGIRELLAREDYEEYVDDSYASLLRELGSEDGGTTCAEGPCEKREHGSSRVELKSLFEDARLSERVGGMLLPLLDQAMDFEDYDSLSGLLPAHVEVFLQRRKIDRLIDVISTLNRHSREKPEELARISRKRLLDFYDRKFIAQAFWLFQTGNEKERNEAVELFTAIGPSCIGALLQLFSEMDGDGTRLLMELLMIFKESTLHRIYRTLSVAETAQIKAQLDFIRKAGDRTSIPHLKPLLKHENPEIRIKALGTLVELGDSESPDFVRQFLGSGDREEQLQAISLCGTYGLNELAEDLAALIKARFWSSTLCSRNEIIIKALGRIGAPRSLPVLERLMRKSGVFFRSRIRRLKLVIYESLKGYPAGSIGNLISIGEKSDDRTIRRLARGLAESQRLAAGEAK